MTPIVVDSDNALGSGRFQSDVDDGYALALLLKKYPDLCLQAVAGNANIKVVEKCNAQLLKFLGMDPVSDEKSSSFKSRFPSYHGADCLALGPLTNVAEAIKLGFVPRQIWVTLGHRAGRGLFPPYFPMEFNLTQDRPAFEKVLQSPVDLTIVPLDVARQLRLSAAVADQLKQSRTGQYLLSKSQRWRLRSLVLKGRLDFPVWDLVSAAAYMDSTCVTLESGTARLYQNSFLRCDVPADGFRVGPTNEVFSRPVKIVTGLNTKKIWNLFFEQIAN